MASEKKWSEFSVGVTIDDADSVLFLDVSAIDAEKNKTILASNFFNVINDKVGKVNLATGFSIHGGTIDKVLTVTETSLIDQDLSKAASVVHGHFDVLAVLPEIRMIDSVSSTKQGIICYDSTFLNQNKTAGGLVIKALESGVNTQAVRINGDAEDGARVSLGRPEASEVPSCDLDIYNATNIFKSHEIPAAGGGAILSTLKTARYPLLTGGTTATAQFYYGFAQYASSLNDGFFVGQAGVSAEYLVVLAGGNTQIGTHIPQGYKFYSHGNIGVKDELTILESAKPSVPAAAVSIYAKTDGKLYALDKNDVEYGLLRVVDNAVGFSVSGGTTSKTLTVVDDSEIDQDLLTSSHVRFRRLEAFDTLPDLTMFYSLDPAKRGIICYDPVLGNQGAVTDGCIVIKAVHSGVNTQGVRINGDAEDHARVSLGRPESDNVPAVDLDVYSVASVESLYETGAAASASTAITTTFKSARYPLLAGGGRTNSAFCMGFTQNAAGFEAQDSIFFGRTGENDTDLRILRSGGVTINSDVDTGERLFVNGTIRSEDYIVFGEIAVPTTPSAGFKLFANSADLGKPYVKLDSGASIDLTAGASLAPSFNSVNLLPSGDPGAPASGINLFYFTPDNVLSIHDGPNTYALDNAAGRVVILPDLTPGFTLNRSHIFVTCDTTTAALTIGWDPAVMKGKIVTIKLVAGANDVILDPTSGNIDGISDFTFNNLYQSVTITSDGTNSWVKGSYAPLS